MFHSQHLEKTPKTPSLEYPKAQLATRAVFHELSLWGLWLCPDLALRLGGSLSQDPSSRFVVLGHLF